MNDRPEKNRKYKKKEILQIVVPIGIILIFLVFAYIGRNAIIPYFRKVISYKKIENNSVKEGDILYFGNDEWNNSWRVLKKEESRALLINEKCVKVACGDFVLDYIVVKNGCVIIPRYTNDISNLYHRDDWNDFVENWLNENYYQNVFSESEKKMISETEVGKVFILSADEAKEYFKDANDRKAAYFKDSIPWWLRSYKRYEDGIINDYVEYDGTINGDGVLYPTQDIGIRPAFWIDL